MRPSVDGARRDYTSCVCEALREYVEGGHRFALRTLDAGEDPMLSEEAKSVVVTIDEWEAFLGLLEAHVRQKWPLEPPAET